MDTTKFFSQLRAGPLFRPSLTQSEVNGVNAILAALDGDPIAYVAYALATAYLETAHSMQPISEMGGDAYFFRMYDIHGNRPEIAKELGNTQPGDGVLFHGRGYVQLTGRALYTKAQAETGYPLVAAPGEALIPSVAAKIMRGGMDGGWFTGRSFSTYLPAAGCAIIEEFTRARYIINGQDRADDIAGYAMEFQGYMS